MKKQGFIYGSFILVVSIIISKVIGIMFKIPLANMLGGTGMAYFSCAYSIFMPVYAISVTGLPAAISRMVAENIAYKNYANVKKIRRAALIGFSLIGFLSSLIIFALAAPFAEYVVGEKNCLQAMYAIAPCIFFGAIISVYRGYFEGLHNMFPTAISQIVESVAKMVLGLGLSYVTLMYCEKTFQTTGKVFGIICSNQTEATAVALPYVAAASILGVTLSSFITFIYIMLRYKLLGDGITKQMCLLHPQTEQKRVLIIKLIKIVLPIAIGSVITNLTSLIDLGTIIKTLKYTFYASPEYFKSKYAMILDESLCFEDLPKFIYGSFTGLAITIFNLVPAITNMFGKGILPNIAESWAVKNRKKIAYNVNSVIGITSIIAIPAGLGIFTLANPILNCLYSSRQQEIFTITNSLAILGIGVIFLSLSIPCFAILQAISRADLPVKIMLFGVVLKLIGNIYLMRITKLNVDGAAISTSVCYLFICIASLIAIRRLTSAKLRIVEIFIKPAFGAILCSVTAYLTYNNLANRLDLRISLAISICFGIIIYIFALFLLDIKKNYQLY